MLSKSRIVQDIFNAFFDLKVVVIGDIMIDHYIHGHANRISPEAPIPIVDVEKEEFRLGGAGNVAMNLKEMGATPHLLSVIGSHDRAAQLRSLLHSNEISSQYVLADQDRKTTIKSRIFSNNQQMLRFDQEVRHPLSEATETNFVSTITEALYEIDPDVLIFQDYNKGVLTPTVIQKTLFTCKQLSIPTVVDPKFEQFWQYKGCTIFKPNLKEASKALGMEIDPNKESDLLACDKQLREKLNHHSTFLTLSDKGIFVGSPRYHEQIPAFQKNVVDVCGAGDTVVSIAALCLALELDIIASAELANIAAAIVCEQVGVVPVNRERLLAETQALTD